MLSRVSKRHTHPTKSLFHQAMNGCHSIELAKEDRPYTTFITPYRHYRYRVTPQIFVCSGDGYKACFDQIKSLEENFRKTFSFLTLVGSNGIILNRERFQFCLKEVN